MENHPACFRERIPLKTQLTRNSIHWPLLLIGFFILLVVGEIAKRLVSASFPPGLIGASIVLSCSAILILLSRFTSKIPLLRTLLISTAMGFVLIGATVAIPGGDSIHILSTAIALGVGLSLFMLNPQPEQQRSVAGITATSILDPQTEAISLDLQEESPALNSEFNDQEETESSQEELLQSWKRLKLHNGIERLEGSLVLKFAVGEKIQHCHLPISPALNSLPQAWCECSDTSVRVEFNVLQTYGVRLTARRGSGPLNEESVEVNFIVESCPNRQAVA
jgi:hypothetical protein